MKRQLPKKIVQAEIIFMPLVLDTINQIIDYLAQTNDYGCIVNAPETPKLPPNWGKINCSGLTDGLSTVKIDFEKMEPQTVGEAAATGRMGGMLKSIFETDEQKENDRKNVENQKISDEQNYRLQEASNRAYQKGQENGKSLEHQKMKNKVKNVIEKYYFGEDWTDLIKDLLNL